MKYKKGYGLHNYTGVNPFKDSQSRLFTDDKVLKEFCPTSTYWSLFNDQHEILLGTRGSGKTILLKMMRYSLLSKLNHDEAKKLALEKKHIGIYVPLNLEFLGSFSYQEVPDKIKLPFFQFAFNCFLAQALIHEIKTIIEELPSFIDQAIISMELANLIMPIWFPNINNNNITCIDDVSSYINEMYYANNINKHDLTSLPRAFTGTVITPLQAISKIIIDVLGLNKDVNWIVCIDEAEFLDTVFQKCINTILRSDSRGVVIKMATLPFKHMTRETLVPGLFAEPNGNDFNYRLIDMKYDSIDFINVTNHLSVKRLGGILDGNPTIVSLDEFTNRLGNDDLVDYYKAASKMTIHNQIEDAIVEEMSPTRKDNSIKIVNTKESRKPIYDKFAPVYFWRQMYKQSKRGNNVPAWYAGPRMIRKVCDGNPRLFIQLMNDMFEYGRQHSSISLTSQHKVIYKFSVKICETTKGLPSYGPKLNLILENISETLKMRVHNGFLIDAGNDFTLNQSDFDDAEIVETLKLGVQYSRLIIDEKSQLDDLSENTIFTLSGCYSVKYWLPMRKSCRPKLSIKNIQQSILSPKCDRKSDDAKQEQLSFGELHEL